MLGEYGKASTWRRIGILLAVLAGLILAPGLLGLVSVLTDPFTEDSPPEDLDFIEIRGTSVFRMFDRDDDGRVDCVLRVPAFLWFRVGYAREESDRCRGRRIKPMPDEMSVLADEAMALRRDHDLWLARLLDVDDDGAVDCATFDGTWRHADGARCPEPLRSDAARFTDAEQAVSDRLLALEGEILDRWLEPLLRD